MVARGNLKLIALKTFFLKILQNSATKVGSMLFCPHPPCFYAPQLEIICCYIARYYVKKIASAPGGVKNINSLWGGGGGGVQNRTQVEVPSGSDL